MSSNTYEIAEWFGPPKLSGPERGWGRKSMGMNRLMPLTWLRPPRSMDEETEWVLELMVRPGYWPDWKKEKGHVTPLRKVKKEDGGFIPRHEATYSSETYLVQKTWFSETDIRWFFPQ